MIIFWQYRLIIQPIFSLYVTNSRKELFGFAARVFDSIARHPRDGVKLSAPFVECLEKAFQDFLTRGFEVAVRTFPCWGRHLIKDLRVHRGA